MLIAAVAWSVLNNTRCHNDVAQWHGVPNLAACEALCVATPPCHLVTYCPPDGAVGCSANTPGQPQPMMCWAYALSELPQCDSNQQGWLSAYTPVPPPPPPPTDWAPKIAAGNMAFTFASPDDIGVGLYPVLGNGFVALEAGPWRQPWLNAWPWRDAGAFHMQGVFTGLNYTGPSHRAQISNLCNVSLVAATGGVYTALGVAIDYAAGVYYNRTLVDAPGCPATIVELRQYAHRTLRELFVLEFHASAADKASNNAWAGCTLPVAWAITPLSPDTQLAVVPGLSDANVTVWAGTTDAPEQAELPLRRLAVAFDSWLAAGPAALVFTPAAPVQMLHVVLRSDLDVGVSATPMDVAVAAVQTWREYATMNASATFASHTAGWAALWATGGVELTGNATLAATVNASLFVAYVLA